MVEETNAQIKPHILARIGTVNSVDSFEVNHHEVHDTFTVEHYNQSRSRAEQVSEPLEFRASPIDQTEYNATSALPDSFLTALMASSLKEPMDGCELGNAECSVTLQSVVAAPCQEPEHVRPESFITDLFGSRKVYPLSSCIFPFACRFSFGIFDLRHRLRPRFTQGAGAT